MILFCFRGVNYQIGMLFVTTIEEDYLTFGEIVIIFIKNNNVYLLMKEFENEYFNEHIFAYKIRVTSAIKHVIKNVMELPDKYPCLKFENENSLYIATRCIL